MLSWMCSICFYQCDSWCMSQVCIGHCARMTRHWMVAQATQEEKQLWEFRSGPPCFWDCPWFMPFSWICFFLWTITKTITERLAFLAKWSWLMGSLPLNIIICLLQSFRCYAYSFAALHCFSQSLFISGTIALAGPVCRFFYPRWKNMAKASGHVDGLLRKRWRVNERHGACRCENWLMVWNMIFMFPYIGNFIIPTDFHIFQRGWNHQPVKPLV